MTCLLCGAYTSADACVFRLSAHYGCCRACADTPEARLLAQSGAELRGRVRLLLEAGCVANARRIVQEALEAVD